ncbi:hypothetical protein PJP07_30345, partial [Mycobacterium kansasii]
NACVKREFEGVAPRDLWPKRKGYRFFVVPDSGSGHQGRALLEQETLLRAKLLSNYSSRLVEE